MPVGVNLNCSV